MATGGRQGGFPQNGRTESNSENNLDALLTLPIPFNSTEARYSRQLAEMEPYFHEDNRQDLSHSDLESFPQFIFERSIDIMSLHFEFNLLSSLPDKIGTFVNLVNLDISNNLLKSICSEVCHLNLLRTFIARNNQLSTESIPKDFGLMRSLNVINMSGNHFTQIPIQFTELPALKSLYLGANKIVEIPKNIENLECLEVLYLGGNRLHSIPSELGNISSLVSLALCDNFIESLPSSLARLSNLQSLSVHNNRLSTLPPEITNLNLVELSLRNNPLVVRFVQDMTYEPPSLMELAGRVIKVKNIPYTPVDIPKSLVSYLDSGHQCVNPKCKGVFFSSRIEHIKFVDFCGKYRLPLLEYLCSPKCTSRPSNPYSSTESDSSDEDNAAAYSPLVGTKMRKVLLG